MSSKERPDSLASLVVDLSESWRQDRDAELDEFFREYYRLWRARWSPKDRKRPRERSRIIMPTTMQAVDAAMAEIEEAIFGRQPWVSTDRPDLDRHLERVQVEWPDKLLEAMLVGAIYGTALGKVTVALGAYDAPEAGFEPMTPDEFIIDTAATCVDDAFGCAHNCFVSYALVLRRQKQGAYARVPVEPTTIPPSHYGYRAGKLTPSNRAPFAGYVELHEYHGLVPYDELGRSQRRQVSKEDRLGEDGLVECIVTVANRQTTLRVEPSPWRDRGFVAAQWGMVPREFWGRGIVDAASNAQRALDGEVRSRLDALAYANSPVMKVNSQQISRHETFEVYPGRNIFMRGDVRTGMQAERFPGPDPQTYQQGQELQKMITLATGIPQDAGMGMGDMSRTSGAAVMPFALAALKRSKQATRRMSRGLIQEAIWRWADRMHQLAPDLYPELTARPKVHSGEGLLERELESMKLGQLAAQLPDGAAKLALLRLVVEHSPRAERSEVLGIIDRLIQQAMNPAPPAPTVAEQIQARKIEADAEADRARFRAEVAKLRADENVERQKYRRELYELAIQAEEAQARITENKAQAALALARAEQIAGESPRREDDDPEPPARPMIDTSGNVAAALRERGRAA